ncbi:MAG: metal-dependent hydrolase [Kordiimonadaceae bacterium]|jgi:inner membrane protein|nr:metal-dependent hydrolase [Kordiimonadaceae bacterium]MBT6031785.1 metal-dependent hydrolase [Kordiimonadaceae bacterium]
MDPFSQAVLGAAFAQSFAKKKQIPLACVAGVFGGMAPDLDIFITSAIDPLLGIEFHRHFTHSLWFIPFGGLLVAMAISLVFKRYQWDFKQIYIFTTLGISTHALLDACTSYGTRLFWPVSNARISWDTVSVIDPIPTMALFIFVILSVRLRSAQMAKIGMACALGYLSLGFLQNSRVTNAVEEIAGVRGHNVERLKLNPTLGNLIVWRSTYQYDGRYYVDAVVAQPFSAPEIIAGSSVAAIDPETIYPELGNNSTHRKDIRRFDYFAQGYLFSPKENVIADLRYSAEPHKIQPIWGITLNPNKPNDHVGYGSFVTPGGRALGTTWDMMTGNYSAQKETLAP